MIDSHRIRLAILTWLQKLASRLKLGHMDKHQPEMYDDAKYSMDSSVRTAIRQNTHKQMQGNARSKDRSDRATVETVLDPRTRMVSCSFSSCLQYLSAYQRSLLGLDVVYLVDTSLADTSNY